MHRITLAAALVVALLSSTGCAKKPAPVVHDPQKAAEGVAEVNAKLPLKLGVALTLTKASFSGDQATFTYIAPYDTPPPVREQASLRGAMVQFACGDAGARKILDSGFDIDHRVLTEETRPLFSTVGNLAVCSNY